MFDIEMKMIVKAINKLADSTDFFTNDLVRYYSDGARELREALNDGYVIEIIAPVASYYNFYYTTIVNMAIAFYMEQITPDEPYYGRLRNFYCCLLAKQIRVVVI